MPLFLLIIFSIHSYNTIVHSIVPSLYSKLGNAGKSRLQLSTVIRPWAIRHTAVQLWFDFLLTVQLRFKGDVLFILWMSPLQKVKRTRFYINISYFNNFGSWTYIVLYQFNLLQHAILKFSQTKFTVPIFLVDKEQIWRTLMQGPHAWKGVGVVGVGRV